MQQEENKVVDIDTSGPGAEIELPEGKKRRRCRTTNRGHNK